MTKHTLHVYNRFLLWLNILREKQPYALALPRLVLFEWFLYSQRFKLSFNEAVWFLQDRYVLEVRK
jgi:hypothetical protein